MTNYSETLILKTSKTLKDRAFDAAEKEDLSLSAFVRAAIRDRIQDHPLAV